MTGENLADLRIRVEPGGGVVAVLRGVLLVIPTVKAGQDDAVEALLTAAVTPGVVRAVARVVADFDEDRIPPFSIVVEGDHGPMFALVHGEVVLDAVGSSDEVRLAGRQARSWVDRDLPANLQRLSVLPPDTEPGEADAYSDLRAGVVRGGGVTVTRKAAPQAPQLRARSEPEPEPEPEPELEPEPADSAESLVSFGAGAGARAPLDGDLDEPDPPDRPDAPDQPVAADQPEPVKAAATPVALSQGATPAPRSVEAPEPVDPAGQAPAPIDEPADMVDEPADMVDEPADMLDEPAEVDVAEPADEVDVAEPADEQPAAGASNGSAYPPRHSVPDWASAFTPAPALSLPAAPAPAPVAPPPLPITPPPSSLPPSLPPPPVPGPLFPSRGIASSPLGSPHQGPPVPVPVAFDPFAQVGPRAEQDTLLHVAAAAEVTFGRLILQDGQDVLVDQDCVIGRNPEADPQVASGRAKAVVLPDAEQRISRVHARLVLDDGAASIIDQGSVNGTWIEPPGTEGWIAVDPDVPTPLPLGTRIQVGDAVLSYAATVHA